MLYRWMDAVVEFFTRRQLKATTLEYQNALRRLQEKHVHLEQVCGQQTDKIMRARGLLSPVATELLISNADSLPFIPLVCQVAAAASSVNIMRQKARDHLSLWRISSMTGEGDSEC